MKQHASIAIATVVLLLSPKLGVTQSNLELIFNQASAAMQAGNYPAAEAGFEQVLAADPHNLAALGNLGVLYARSHRFAAAISSYRRALEVDPHNDGLLLNLGLAYLKEEDYARARPYLEQLTTQSPANTQAAILLATCFVLGDAPQAGLDLLLARKLQEPSALYLEMVAYTRLNQIEAGKRVLAHLLSKSGTEAQASFLMGQVLHDGHHLQEAAGSLEQTLRLDPAFPGAHRELGKVYISMQHFDDAERELQQAVAQDPRDASAIYFLGAMLVQSGRYSDGIPFLQRAAPLLPDSWAIPFYLGKAHVNLHQPALAVPELQQAAALNADEPSVFYLLATALRSTGHPDEAKAAMLRVEQLHSTVLEAEKAVMRTRVAGSR